MSCEITFSRYLANEDIPEHGIVAGSWYWRSDQQVRDDSGALVHLIGHRFLQREDEDDGIRPPRVAGNAYLVFLNCIAAGGTTGECSYGACNKEHCCELKFEIDCFDTFMGNGTECVLPDCHEEGVCCDFAHASDCMEMELEPCLVNHGIFIPDVTCATSPCDGACCFWSGQTGLGCAENFGPFECRQLPGSPGFENITYSIWRGPGSACPAEDCDPAVEECCPGEGACCRKTGPDVWTCATESPDDCVDDGSDDPPVFKGIGTVCETTGICGGACCEFQLHIPGGGCEDVDDNSPDCIGPTKVFLGPGTTCQDNAGDCGLCCLVDTNTCAISCDEDLLQEECISAGGTPFGPGASCEICDLVTRACCIPRFKRRPDLQPPGEDDDDHICGGIQYLCVEVSSCTQCEQLGGFFHPNEDCSLNPCLLLGGACCCPSNVCPGNNPCPEHGPDQDCRCYHVLEEDCPGGQEGCVWHGPGRGCDYFNFPPSGFPPQPDMPEFCLFKCLSCMPDPDPGQMR